MWEQVVDIMLNAITGVFGFMGDIFSKLEGFNMTWLYLFLAFTAYRLVIAPLLRASVNDKLKVDKPKPDKK